jgi:hypothetical protein
MSAPAAGGESVCLSAVPYRAKPKRRGVRRSSGATSPGPRHGLSAERIKASVEV